MSTRVCKLVAIAGAVSLIGTAVLWFTVLGDKGKPPTQQPKTTAEQLVGTWKRVQRTPPLSGPAQITVEYTSEGTVIRWQEVPSTELLLNIGVYRVEANTLILTWEGENEEYRLTIESITQDKLVTSGTVGAERYVTEYERVQRKQ